jgi:hypothetical protein
MIRRYKRQLFSWSSWIKLLSGKNKLLTVRNLSAGLQIVTAKLKKKRDKQGSAIDTSDSIASWEKLFGRNVKVQMVFCERNDAIDVYNLSLAKPLDHYRTIGMLATAFVRNVDHTFTPLWAQKHLSDLTTNWLNKEFKR